MAERDSRRAELSLKKTLKLLSLVAVLSLNFLSYEALYAAAPHNIVETNHNLSSSAIGGAFGSTDVSEVCVFCHTPHNAVMNYPLWNRTTAPRVFTLYSSHTLHATMPADLASDSASRLCLSCHDGVTAINAIIRYGSFGHKPTMGGSGETLSAIDGNTANLGTSLRDDHPVGFNYETAQVADGKLNPISDVKDAGLKFFGSGANMMECPTCHDPHVDYDYIRGFGDYIGTPGDYRYKPFLRKTNESSELCFTCHNK